VKVYLDGNPSMTAIAGYKKISKNYTVEAVSKSTSKNLRKYGVK
jgi:hypothetical protein